MAALILIFLIFADSVSRDEDGLISKLPDSLWSVPPVGVRILLAISLLQFVFVDGLLLNISILFAFVVWRKLASLQLKRKFGGNIDFTNSWRNVFCLFTFIALFDAVTMNYSGALGEFFLQNQWTPTGACADRRSLCDTMSFGVNSYCYNPASCIWSVINCCTTGVELQFTFQNMLTPDSLQSLNQPWKSLQSAIGSIRILRIHLYRSIVVEFGEYAFAEAGLMNHPMF